MRCVNIKQNKDKIVELPIDPLHFGAFLIISSTCEASAQSGCQKWEFLHAISLRT